jgi:predicted nucleic acid binding AN1-type Zn finger protein
MQMGAYTVPIRGQRTASRENNDKMKYNTDGSLQCTNLGPEDRIPKGSLHCTNYGPEDRIPRNDKMTYDTNGSLHCTN